MWPDDRITSYIVGNRGAADRGWTQWEVDRFARQIRDDYEAAQGNPAAAPLISATEVVYQALTVYAILCGVDEMRIEAAELLDRVKAAREAV